MTFTEQTINGFKTIGEVRHQLANEGWRLEISGSWEHPDRPGCTRDIRKCGMKGFAIVERRQAPQLEGEGGCTFASLHNAKVLLAERGRPVRLNFVADTRRADYFVTAQWNDARRFTFTGFSWGYGGTGCQGLNEFLKMVGVANLDSWTVPIVDGKTSMIHEIG